jgi:hypothetical protein
MRMRRAALLCPTCWTQACGKHCVHCEADITTNAHQPACPVETNLWPVTLRALEPYGMRCCDCGNGFTLGDTYTTRPTGRDPAIVYVVCLSCAAREALLT